MAKQDKQGARTPPKWGRDVSSYANSVGDNFKSDLKAIAESFASHERLDSVSVKHVDESFSALSRLGLHSKRFWQRSDTWTAVGALLVGVSFSMPDACSAISGICNFTENVQKVASAASMIVVMGLGLGLYFWALFHGSLPKKPGAA